MDKITDHDFATSQFFKPADVGERSIIYLHGKYTGFKLLNTEDEFRQHSEYMQPVFADAGNGRTWIVVGYSGLSDPVFEHLAAVNRFDDNLYWIGYLDGLPSEDVRARILVEGKCAFLVRGFDSDRFFVQLAKKLNCFPPGFLIDAQKHLNELERLMTAYIIDSSSSEAQIGEETPESISSRISLSQEILEELTSKIVVLAWTYVEEKQFDKLIALVNKLTKQEIKSIAGPLSIAYVAKGSECYSQSQVKQGTEAEDLLNKAIMYFRQAEDVLPGMGQTFLASNGGLTGA